MAEQYLPAVELRVVKNLQLAMNLSSPLNCSSLRKKNEITFVIKNGKKIKTKIGPVFLYNDFEERKNKAAILVKKNIGKAHFRNYIKRIIRYYIRSEVTLFEEFNRVIFLYVSSEKKVKYSQIKSTYDKALKSA